VHELDQLIPSVIGIVDFVTSSFKASTPVGSHHAEKSHLLFNGRIDSATRKAGHVRHVQDKLFPARGTFFHGKIVRLHGLEEILLLILVCGSFHVLGKPFQDTVLERVDSAGSIGSKDCIPMTTGLTTKALTPVLKEEWSCRQGETISGTHIFKLFIDTAGQLRIRFVSHKWNLGTTTDIMATDGDIAFKLDSFNRQRKLALHRDRRVNIRHDEWV
jgi:hypothetical protein